MKSKDDRGCTVDQALKWTMPCGSQKIFPKLHPRKTNSWKSLKIHVPFFLGCWAVGFRAGLYPISLKAGHLAETTPTSRDAQGMSANVPFRKWGSRGKCFFKRPMVDDVFSYFLFKSCEFCVFSFCSMSQDLCVFLLVAAEAAAKLSLKLAELFFFATWIPSCPLFWVVYGKIPHNRPQRYLPWFFGVGIHLATWPPKKDGFDVKQKNGSTLLQI